MQSKMFTIKCTHCGSEWMVKGESIINAQNEKTFKKMIMDESFFTRKCSKCGTLITFYYPFLFCDIKRKYLIAIVSNSQTWIHSLESIDQYQSFKKRIVSTIQQLKEKINIFDNDLNDLSISYIKENIASQYNDLFFESIDTDGLLWFTSDKGFIAIEKRFYEEIENNDKKFMKIK